MKTWKDFCGYTDMEYNILCLLKELTFTVDNAAAGLTFSCPATLKSILRRRLESPAE